MKKVIKIKSSTILGILGIIFGFLGGMFALFLGVFSTSILINAFIAIISSLMGILAIWLSDKDATIAAVEYLIAGFGVLIGVSFFGVLGFIFFIIAAILCFKDRNFAVPVKGVEQ